MSLFRRFYAASCLLEWASGTILCTVDSIQPIEVPVIKLNCFYQWLLTNAVRIKKVNTVYARKWRKNFKWCRKIIARLTRGSNYHSTRFNLIWKNKFWYLVIHAPLNNIYAFNLIFFFSLINRTTLFTGTAKLPQRAPWRVLDTKHICKTFIENASNHKYLNEYCQMKGAYTKNESN